MGAAVVFSEYWVSSTPRFSLPSRRADHLSPSFADSNRILGSWIEDHPRWKSHLCWKWTYCWDLLHRSFEIRPPSSTYDADLVPFTRSFAVSTS